MQGIIKPVDRKLIMTDATRPTVNPPESVKSADWIVSGFARRWNQRSGNWVIERSSHLAIELADRLIA